MSDDRPLDRRRFFRVGLRELLKPLANAAAPIERALNEFEAMTGGAGGNGGGRRRGRRLAVAGR